MGGIGIDLIVPIVIFESLHCKRNKPVCEKFLCGTVKKSFFIAQMCF